MKKTTLSLLFLACTGAAQASIVELQTSAGTFTLNLYDESTPLTVQNFLSYVDSGAYDNTVIHRSEPGFVIQGGGFYFDNAWPLKARATTTPVKNEPKWSNTRGTIAMAKVSGNPDSATNQWFINLADNGANLDSQNSGFTVFGQVEGTGMTTVDNIAAISRYNFGGAFGAIPLTNYSADKAQQGIYPAAENVVMIYKATVLDRSANTASQLNPKPNTSSSTPNPTTGDSGGGSTTPAMLIALLTLVAWRRKS